MHISRSLGFFLASACAALLVACSSPQGIEDTGASTGNNTTSSPATTLEPSKAITVPTDVYGNPTTPKLPDFGKLNVTSTFKPNSAPASKDRNGVVNVEAFLQAVMRSNRDVWMQVLGDAGLQTPPLTYDVTSGSDRYVSACTKDGTAITVTPSYDSLFYCSLDNKPYGSIALPLDTMSAIWENGTDRSVQDLAGAIAASQQANLILITSIQQQLAVKNTNAVGQYYTSTCLTGAWMHATYEQTAFTDKQLSDALAYAYAVPTEFDGAAAPADPTAELKAACLLGFRQGNPGYCGMVYWY